MRGRIIFRAGLLVSVVALWAGPAWAVTLSIDYSYDTSNFFGSGNPQGTAAGNQARDALEAAADYFSTILEDSFSAIATPLPNPRHSQFFDGVAEWHWTMAFRNPSLATTTTVALEDQTIAEDEYRIYAGGHALSGNTVGRGGVGTYGYEYEYDGSSHWSSSEYADVQDDTDNFVEAVTTRGQTDGGFNRWGGSVSFDNDGSTNWNFDHTSLPGLNEIDFYSVAIHELGHALGIGEFLQPPNEGVWESLVSGTNFVGSAAMAEYGGPVPLHTADLAHWASGTTSTVFGGSASQETSMDPEISQHTRKLWTDLDAAALTDLGWTVVEPPGPDLPGDYNEDGVVNAADYTVWRNNKGLSVTLPNDETPGSVDQGDYTVWRANYGESAGGGASGAAVPEPGSLFLAVLALAAGLGRWRHRAQV